MHDENVRVREKFELSLDGRQIASIVVGALVILGVVFVLGLNVGRQIAARQVEAARGGDLTALDRVPVAAQAEPAKGDITFYDQLPKGKPTPPPPEPARPIPAPAQAAATPSPSTATSTPTPATAPPATTPTPAVTPPAPAVAAAIATPAVAAPVPRPSASPSPAPARKVPAASTPPGGGFVVQLAATQNRAEAERLAARHRGLSPRIEVADVAGKGRFYRVRAGSFASRADAERYLAQASRQSGVKGYVTSSR